MIITEYNYTFFLHNYYSYYILEKYLIDKALEMINVYLYYIQGIFEKL